MRKRLNLRFVDFKGSEGTIRPLRARIAQFYDIDETAQPDYIIYSVFGQEHLKYNDCVKIFWTGENQAPDFNLCDYAIGFEHLEFGDRYLRFPLWLFYEKDTPLMAEKHRKASLEGKDSFCSFVYSNSNASPERETMLNMLSEYKTVSSGGRYRNNVGGPVADKLAFQQRHKFAIAFENASHEGYTTEKLVQAFAAGTVPVYWGDPRVGETFNTDSFVNCADYPDFAAVSERIRQIDQDDALWLRMAAAPALRDPETIDRSFAGLDAFLRLIFEQEPLSARRFSRDYWALKQLRQRQREVRAYQRSFAGRFESFYNSHLHAFMKRHPFLWNTIQRLKRRHNW